MSNELTTTNNNGAAVQEAGYFTADGSTLYTCKTSKPRVTVDTARLKKEQPEIYAQYLTEGKAARPVRIIDKDTDQ